VILGCEPEAFICFNDPDQNVGTLTTNDTIGKNLTATGALLVVVHASSIGLNTVVQGGGGGVTCDNFPLGPDGPPAYIDFEDNTIGGNSIIQGVQSCWAGYIRNNVSRNVIYQGNSFADPDARELTTNTVGQNMICSGNLAGAIEIARHPEHCRRQSNRRVQERCRSRRYETAN
jgi:hypothetical protein